MKKTVGWFIACIFGVASLPLSFAFGIGLLDSDEAYMKRHNMSVEEALEKGVLKHPENYTGHCDFSQFPECDEYNELMVIFGD